MWAIRAEDEQREMLRIRADPAVMAEMQRLVDIRRAEWAYLVGHWAMGRPQTLEERRPVVSAPSSSPHEPQRRCRCCGILNGVTHSVEVLRYH